MNVHPAAGAPEAGVVTFTSCPDGATRVELLVEGQSVSGCFIVPMSIHVGAAIVRVDGIGGVATETEHRQRGYSRRVLSAAVARMRQGDAALSMLYGIPDFYPKFGYVSAGPDHLLVFGRLGSLPDLPHGWSVRPLEPAHLADLRRLYGAAARAGVGGRVRTPDRGSWLHLTGAAIGEREEDCRVAIGPDQRPHGYALRGKAYWYVGMHLDPQYPEGLVLAEAVADGPEAADAVLAMGGAWAREEARRRGKPVSQLVLAGPPEGPIAAAAGRCTCRLQADYEATGGSMARTLHTGRLLTSLAPELTLRAAAACLAPGSLRIVTETGEAALTWDGRAARVDEDCSAPPLPLPQQAVARLALGAFEPQDLVARLRGVGDGPVLDMLSALFPKRNPHMYLPDRY